MGYISLSKLFYQDQTVYLETYQRRYNSEYTVKLDFDIKGNNAFFVQTPEIYGLLTDILRANKSVCRLCMVLPKAAISQFSRKCLIDEIVLTNSIEGVRSTRKEIRDILDELEEQSKGKHFYGLVQKYYMLMAKEELPMQTCEDVRRIYDELVLAEVAEEKKSNVPDGKWFRKGPVSVYSPAQKEIHSGLYPEDKIIDAMEMALAFLNSDSCDILFRIAIFHYLLEYIHPFYDGNGRLGRFICSYLLARELEPVTGYRLSYTIKEHIDQYYKAFTICNDPNSKGDLTPFLQTFLTIIKTSVDKLEESLAQKLTKLEWCFQRIPGMVGPEEDETLSDIYYLLIQAALFSEFGVSTNIVLKHVGISRATLKRKLEKIPARLLVKNKRGKTNYYSVDTDILLSTAPSDDS